MRPSPNSTPRPSPSTPQLFEKTSRSVADDCATASMSLSGMPHRPNPPTASETPSVMSRTASAAESYTFDDMLLLLRDHHVHSANAGQNDAPARFCARELGNEHSRWLGSGGSTFGEL